MSEKIHHKSLYHIIEFQRIPSQSGWTFWSLLFVLSVVLFFSCIIFQLVPVYASNDNVHNAMERSLKDSDLRTINRAAIIRKIDSQLYLDGRHDLIDYRNDIKVKRSRQQIILEASYHREIPLFLI